MLYRVGQKMAQFVLNTLTLSSVWTTSAYRSKHCTGSYKRRPGRPRANWRSIVNKDLQKIRFTWEEAEVVALDRHGWHRSVAQCVQLDTGWTKVKVKTECTAFFHVLRVRLPVANQGKINHICSVIPASKFDAYTNYVNNDVKCNGVWLNLET